MANPISRWPLLSYLLPLLLWPLLTTSSTTDPTVTITVSPSASPTSPSYTSPSNLRSSLLNSTNTYRYQHSVPALTWNSSLATIAQSYSSNCHFQHSGTPSLGENLAMGYPDITSAVDGWGSERVNYSWTDPGFSEATGHFTQLIWKETRSTGCGVSNCEGQNGLQGWLLVCEYYPQGNVLASNSNSKTPHPSSAAAAYFISDVPPQAHSDPMPPGWQETATAAAPVPTSSTGDGSGVQVSPAATVTVGVKSGASKGEGGRWGVLVGVVGVLGAFMVGW